MIYDTPMSSSQNIWTVLETYSFIQGFLLAIYAFFYLRRRFLSALLIAISFLLAAHLFYHFRWFYTYPNLIFMEAPIWYLIGPLFYFFTRKIFDEKIKWFAVFHLVPFFIFIAYIFPFYLEPAETKITLFEALFSERTYRTDINRYIFSVHIFIYVLYSYLVFTRKAEKLRQSNAHSYLIFDSVALNILRYYLIFSFIGMLAYLIVADSYSWSSDFYAVYYLALSLLIHFTFYYALLRPDRHSIEVSTVQKVGEDAKYSSSSLADDEMEAIVDKVIAHIENFDVYRNPELRLRMVADDLGIPMHHISQSINQKGKLSFFDLVNSQRIKGFKQNINDPKFRNYTLVGIASEHGFRSPSSFYRIFKKYTGKTPKEYFQKEV